MLYATSDLYGYPFDKFMDLLEKANFSDGDYCFVPGGIRRRSDSAEA